MRHREFVIPHRDRLGTQYAATSLSLIVNQGYLIKPASDSLKKHLHTYSNRNILVRKATGSR